VDKVEIILTSLVLAGLFVLAGHHGVKALAPAKKPEYYCLGGYKAVHIEADGREQTALVLTENPKTRRIELTGCGEHPWIAKDRQKLLRELADMVTEYDRAKARD
jgi:hypothetical protein